MKGLGLQTGALRPVRRHDAAHRLLLHVLQLRQQHRFRLIVSVHFDVPSFGTSQR